MNTREHPQYSIIIPHFNSPHKLRRLLLSIPERDDLQIVVVDDTSTKMISEFEALKHEFSYVEFYSTVINGGGGKARNIGLDHATGNYVIFADSDDFFTPEFPKVLDKYLLSDSADIIFCNATSIFEDTTKKSSRADYLQRYIELYLKKSEKGEILLRYGFGEPWCKIIKRSMISEHNIRFDELRIHNDTKFSYLIGIHAVIIVCDNTVIYCVTDSPKSVSKAVNWDYLKIRAQVFAEKEQLLRKLNIDYSDPITYTPLFISILNLNIKGLKEIGKIYASCGLTYPYLFRHSFKALFFYSSHRLGRISKYLNLR